MQVNKSSCGVFLSCIAVLLLAAATFGTEVLSSRPAGVIKISLSTNEQKMVSLPFKPFDPSLDAVMAGQLKGSSEERVSDRVMKWDGVALRYEQAYKADGTGDKDIDGKWYSSFDPLVESAMTLNPGEGFVIWNRQGQLQEVYLSGDVVLAATNNAVLNSALNMVGYPYSSSGNAPSNMTFRTDNGTGYVEAANLEMGKGYWVENSNITAEVWTEIRPYGVEVYPPVGSRPDILWINAVSSGGTGKVELVLTIDCEGLPADEKLDVYYKDLPVDGVFEAEKDWLIAEQDMPVHGRNLVEWVDSSASLQPAGSGLQTSSARYYLIGRASVDLDQNGIPDCRERFTGLTSGQETVPLDETPMEMMMQTVPAVQGAHSGLSTNTVPNLGRQKKVFISRVIYVSRQIGHDMLSGKSPLVEGTEGPKQAITSGLGVMPERGTMVIKSGVYEEGLNIVGRGIRVNIDGNVRIGRRRETMPSAVVNEPVVYNEPVTNVVKKIK